ncbi:hypothetical protein TNCV_3846141 [Trichonephila clavipes]|nr:hypothetical protein TNCV_3846141 [Trichonephila clavipes]
MGQHFQIDGKKSQLFKHFPLVRALDDDEASVSLGQVTKLAPDVESQGQGSTIQMNQTARFSTRFHHIDESNLAASNCAKAPPYR